MKVQSDVRTCLWFESKGLEAAQFYCSLLPDSHIDGGFEPHETDPLVVEFTLAGAPMMILNGGPMFTLSEAASISVRTDSQEETDRLWDALMADGGGEGNCGWLKDKYGLSWQICPKRLVELFNDPDREAAGRVRDAMMTMAKIDIAALEAAFRGD